MFLFESKKHIGERSKSDPYSAPLGDGLTIQVGYILSSFLVMMLLFATDVSFCPDAATRSLAKGDQF